MGVVSDRGTVNGLLQRTAQGRLFRRAAARTGVIMLPGATQDADWWFGANILARTLGAREGEIDVITRAGYPIATMGTLNSWGNAAQRAQISTLRTNAQASGLFAAGKVHVVGVSAGGQAACNWALANPALVESLTLLIPVVNAQGVYDENRGSFAASLSAAYGGRPSNAENPVSNAASFASFPTQIFYSTTDTITTVAEIQAFAAGSGAKLRSMGAIGHFWGAPWNGQAVVRFLDNPTEVVGDPPPDDPDPPDPDNPAYNALTSVTTLELDAPLPAGSVWQSSPIDVLSPFYTPTVSSTPRSICVVECDVATTVYYDSAPVDAATWTAIRSVSLPAGGGTVNVAYNSGAPFTRFRVEIPGIVASTYTRVRTGVQHP